jgi:hypothetical protein
MEMIPRTMEAIRLHGPGIHGLRHETIDTPALQRGEALVAVHAAAIRRDELEWPLDRLPAIPSYELSGRRRHVTRQEAPPAAELERQPVAARHHRPKLCHRRARSRRASTTLTCDGRYCVALRDPL